MRRIPRFGWVAVLVAGAFAPIRAADPPPPATLTARPIALPGASGRLDLD